jgi:hypothetical protein
VNVSSLANRWWTLLAGGARWLALPEAPERVQQARAEACAACPHLRVYEERSLARLPRTGWCGEPGIARGVECGCLVLAESLAGVTVRGRPMAAAGKATRTGVQCGAGRWPDDEIRDLPAQR